MHFSSALVDAVNRSFLGKSKIAAIIGCSPSQFSQWLHRVRQPSSDDLRLRVLADVVGVEFDRAFEVPEHSDDAFGAPRSTENAK